jgi:hypothetical protein
VDELSWMESVFHFFISSLYSLLLWGGRTVRTLHCDHFWYNVRPHLIIIPDSSTRALWQLLAETFNSEAGESRRAMAAFCTRSISFILVGFLTCCKILRHGTESFTFPQKEVVLRIVIALKSHRSQPDFNPRILGPMAGMLTTRPPRATLFTHYHQVY